MIFINKGIEIIAVSCMIFAFVSAGNELIEAFKDTLGYMIYLSVFAIPVVVFLNRRKKSLAQNKDNEH